MVHPYIGTLLSNKKGQNIDTGNNLDEFERITLKGKIYFPKISQYVIPFIKYSWNYKIIAMENKLVISCQGLKRGQDGKDMGFAVNEQHEESLWWWKYFISWLYKC